MLHVCIVSYSQVFVNWRLDGWVVDGVFLSRFLFSFQVELLGGYDNNYVYACQSMKIVF